MESFMLDTDIAPAVLEEELYRSQRFVCKACGCQHKYIYDQLILSRDQLNERQWSVRTKLQCSRGVTDKRQRR